MTLRKLIGQVLGYGRALPHLVCYRTACLVLGRERAFRAAGERLSLIPGHVGLYARAAFYRRVLAHVGRDVHFGFMSVLSKREAVIGDRVYIGRFCSLGLVTLGDDVMLADAVQVLSGRHQHGRSGQAGVLRDNEQVYTRVAVGRGAWLGASSVVMADVGDNALVAAGAVVVEPVNAYARVGGVPAKPLSDEPPARLAVPRPDQPILPLYPPSRRKLSA